MSRILSVNLAKPELSTAKDVGVTGINKLPAHGRIAVRAPEPGASGVVGDQIFDTGVHGGDDQAVYAYAREDYEWWERELGRDLRNGLFGDNLTTRGLDVNGALIGERWRIGHDLVLEATAPRIPCTTFQAKIGEPQWIKRFTKEARPGAYLRVVEPGEVGEGDEITIVHRPAHEITIAVVFRAETLEPELLPLLLEPDEISEDLKAYVRKRLGQETSGQ